MASDLWSYLFALYDKYQAITSIAVPAFAVGWLLGLFRWLQKKTGFRFEQFIRPLRLAIAFVVVFLAGFLAWKDEHEALNKRTLRYSYALGVGGSIERDYSDVKKPVSLHLNLENTSDLAIEIASSQAFTSINNTQQTLHSLNGFKLRAKNSANYGWDLSNLDTLPSNGSAQIDVTIQYGPPDQGPTRKLSGSIIVEYEINSSKIISNKSRLINEKEEEIQ